MRAPDFLYDVKYIELVSPRLFVGGIRGSHLDLGRAPYCYVWYRVKYIDLVSLAFVAGGSDRCAHQRAPDDDRGGVL